MRSPFDELKLLIDDKDHKELQCRKYLELTKDRLVKCTPLSFKRFTPEYRGHTGDSDLIVSCETVNDADKKNTEVYIWEIKSPQCYIFEFDNSNRVKPSSALISAENQLIHYFEEYQKSSQFLEEFELISPDNLHIGGIIIGSANTLVKPHEKYVEEQTIKSLYTRAITYRKKHFYKSSAIELIIWDRILDLLRPRQ
ncbi:hypothetical protein Q1J45_10600 [Pseudomonas rhodesiae]